MTAYAPGSTSNVGPGFDCLGIAVAGIGDRVSASRAARPGVRVLSVSDTRIPREATLNTAALGAAEVLRRLGREQDGVELVIEKGLPLSGGLGGSAASAVAGAFATHALLGGSLGEAELLRCAIEAEAVVAGRHPDNAAPSLLGGAVVVLGAEPLRYTRVGVHSSLRLVFVTPAYGVLTAHARSVLPESVPRADAVAQAAALAGLVLGLERGDGELIEAAMVDRIAEPRRIPLYPGFAPAREAALGAGAFGVAVSGAGPTLLALAPAARADAVARAVAAAYEGEGVASAVHVAGVDDRGARLE
ncbi:MAG TPA: homoserine kinase [Vicinamibacteria bacterium]|nr:homoserine kinase [Vicinamibacteria bacterium]